jgi:hypothetical protein
MSSRLFQQLIIRQEELTIRQEESNAEKKSPILPTD